MNEEKGHKVECEGRWYGRLRAHWRSGAIVEDGIGVYTRTRLDTEDGWVWRLAGIREVEVSRGDFQGR